MPAARSTRARPRQISFVPAPLRNAFPDYFALVMATGIVSIALADQGFSTAAWTLFIVNAIAYGLLWGCGFTRLAAGVREAVAGLADHRAGPAFLTIVAGTSVLGVQCIRLAQWPAAAGALWLASLVLWFVLLYGFFAAVTRHDQQGKPPGGWFPDQRMTRDEALRSFTLEGAYAGFEERDKGSLATGKLADLVVLSDDILTCPEDRIEKMDVMMTMVGGKVVFEREGSRPPSQ